MYSLSKKRQRTEKQMGNKYKYIDKHSLNLINHISRDIIKYNRALPQEVIDALPDKCFPIVFSMLHEHIAGKPVEPHVRCMIAVQTVDESGEVTGSDRLLLDMEMGLFDLLPEVELPEEPKREAASV